MTNRNERTTTRREFLANGLASAAASGMALTFGAALSAGTDKPRHRFSLDPFEVQREGHVVYNYGTHTKSVTPERARDWFNLTGHNFGGCRD